MGRKVFGAKSGKGFGTKCLNESATRLDFIVTIMKRIFTQPILSM